MLKRLVAVLVVASGAVSAIPAGAAWHEQWTATSTTSMALTGNVTLFDDRIVFAHSGALSIAKVRNILFASGAGPAAPATIYRVSKPRPMGFCGSRPVTYLVIWHVKPILPGMAVGRGLAPFTTGGEPAPSADGSCGTFFYEPA